MIPMTMMTAGSSYGNTLLSFYRSLSSELLENSSFLSDSPYLSRKVTSQLILTETLVVEGIHYHEEQHSSFFQEMHSKGQTLSVAQT